jgi:Matrixin
MSKSRARLRVETLEGRDVPAAFGLPWGNASHLTLSFAPDGTDVAGQTNTLQTEFANHPTWQADILRAFQTWAVQANINIALTEDGGQPFGAAGALQNDARFGDIRIGAAPMSGESVSISAPHDPFLAGTWAGDVVFNTDKAFGPGAANVFAVALHEAGHVFGLDHNPSRTSAMYSHLGTGPARLSLGDVTNLRSLYGARAADKYEKGLYGNNYLSTATRLDVLADDGEFDGDTPLAVYGDLRTARDVDTFALVLNNGYTGPATFRLQTAGVSLLNPKLTILDSAGRVVATQVSNKLGGDVLEITVPVEAGKKYYARVSAGATDVFDVGGYALAVTLDNRLDPAIDEERIDAVLRGPYQSLTQEDLEYLFEDPSYLLNEDDGSNENAGSATRLQLPRGYQSRTHFEYLGSLANAADADTYAVRTPLWGRVGALTATVWTASPTALPPTIQVTDRLGNVLPTQILSNGNGTYTVQLAGARPNTDYFVRLTGRAAGNYSLAIDLTRVGAAVASYGSVPLTAKQPNAGKALYVAQSQVFDFLLTAEGATGSVRMSVMERVRVNGNDRLVPRYTLTAAAGQTVSGPGVFLKGGVYAIVFESLNGATGYSLRGAGLTVPIGPVTTDPSGQPVFTLPDAPPGQYVYPGDLLGYDPFLANLLATLYQIPVQPPAEPPDKTSQSPYWLADLF